MRLLAASAAGQPSDHRATTEDRAVSIAETAACRNALGNLRALAAAGPLADAEECRRALDKVVRWIDEVGEPTATALRRWWAGEWFAESACCPMCGSPGELHEPEGGA